MTEHRTFRRECDTCGANLTETKYYPEETCIEVRPIAVPNTADSAYAIMQSPVLPRKFHFCGIACLRKWDRIAGGEG